MSDDNDSFLCSTCCASFRRSEHLRRHVASHSSSRPFKCRSCSSGFKRRDVLRKHLKGCSLRLNREIAMPEPLPVGKKITSCDQCAHTKKRCDRKAPCSTCDAKGNICTYERRMSSSNPSSIRSQGGTPQFFDHDEYASEVEVNYDFEDDLGPPGPFLVQNLTDGDWLDLDWNVHFPEPLQVENPPTHDELPSRNFGQTTTNIQLEFSFNPTPTSEVTKFRPSFDFLLNFTRASGLKAGFNYKRSRSQRITTCHSNKEPSEDETISQMIESEFQQYRPRATGSSLFLSQYRMSLVGFIESLDDPLFVQTKAIWNSFRASRIRLSLQSIDNPERGDEFCLQFFSPENLRRFTRLFWDEWYPHCPILHKPTFDILHAPVTLLVPMAIIGACMSPIVDEVNLAKRWLEFGEEIVFSSAILSAEPVERPASGIGFPPIRTIQAAYITCILLNWEGTDTMKRRVRHHHFAAVVSAVREIGLASSNHYPVDYVDEYNFSWENFIEREEAIRIFTYVFLLDTAFIIFNNTPPRMVLHEMNLEMTTSESCFQAETAASCYTHWQAHVSPQFSLQSSTTLRLNEAIGILMRDNYEKNASRFTNLSTLSLFTLAGGFHTVMFQQLSLFSCLPTSVAPVRAALSRWHSLWPLRSDNVWENEGVARESWRDTGFIGQAQEFAWLVSARLDKLEAQTLIDEARPTTPLVEAVSGRLDDTSMTLVTNLMLSLTVGGS